MATNLLSDYIYLTVYNIATLKYGLLVTVTSKLTGEFFLLHNYLGKFGYSEKTMKLNTTFQYAYCTNKCILFSTA